MIHNLQIEGLEASMVMLLKACIIDHMSGNTHMIKYVKMMIELLMSLENNNSPFSDKHYLPGTTMRR